MAQPVVTEIQWLDDLSGEVAQGVLHALDVHFHRYLPVVAFRENIGQPNHRRPTPTDPPLLPMPGDMPVEHLHKAHLDHLTDEQGHIVYPLCDDHQVAVPKDLLRLLRQLHSHRAFLSRAYAAGERS